jgi:uncharacterized Zn finger protein
MSWNYYPAYVPAAERRKKAEAAAKKLAKKSGRSLAPISLSSKKIASTFWGKAWCDNLESYSDYENRLPRGRTYVRNGSVIDLQISEGKVQAMVQGSSLYKIKIDFKRLPTNHWTDFKTRSAGKVTNLLDLLQGRLSKDILAEITSAKTGLFPSPNEIDLDCSCPDWADMCKHVAAVLYGVGARLDEKPELFFTLRGVDVQELLTAASAAVAEPTVQQLGSEVLADSDLSDIFGVEVETTQKVVTIEVSRPISKGRTKRKTIKKTGKKKTGL